MFVIQNPIGRRFFPQQLHIIRLNILYIVLDDVGISAANCFGNPVIETPNIDRIANLGLRYSNWHTTALCSPTRSCLLQAEMRIEIIWRVLSKEPMVFQA